MPSTKKQFTKIYELYYDIIKGKNALPTNPDVVIYNSSICESIRIDIYIHGYTKNDYPDYTYYLSADSSKYDYDSAISILELCAEIVKISKKHLAYQ